MPTHSNAQVIEKEKRRYETNRESLYRTSLTEKIKKFVQSYVNDLRKR